MQIYDLSQILENGMSQFPGQPSFELSKLSDVENEGCQVTDFHSVVHVGTHCDSPAHFILNAQSIENTPLENFVGEAVIVDVLKKEGREILLEDFHTDEIKKGDIVLFRTGAWERWNTLEYASSCPYFSEEAAKWLVEKGVRCIGLDFISPDSAETIDSPIHHILLGAGITIIENLRALEQIKKNRIFFSAAPLKIKDGDGAFTRAYAIEF
jgi:arylformamidase